MAVGILPFKSGMSEWKKNLSERFTDRQSQPILWTSKTVRFLLEITKTKTFYNFGISSQESSLKLLTLTNHQTETHTVLVLHSHTNLIKIWLDAFCQDQTKLKYLMTKNWSHKFSYRRLLWPLTFTSTIKKTLWLLEVWKVRFTW